MRAISARFPAFLCLATCAILVSCRSSRQRGTSPGGPSSESLTKTQPFAPGQQVHFGISVGDVRVLPAHGDDELRLVIHPKHAVPSSEMQSWVRQFDVSGNQANIQLQPPKGGNVTVTLYVPSSTALNINMDVGNLDVDRVRGDKNISVGVGNLTLGSLNPDEYGMVSLSTGVGNLEDSVFSAQQSGLVGKSENTVGKGKFQIRAHVGTGNLRLQKGSLTGTD